MLQEKISELIGVRQNRISEIIGNTNFGEIDNLLSQDRDMDYIAKHDNMDLTLARPIRLRRCRWRAGMGFMYLHCFVCTGYFLMKRVKQAFF